MRGEETRRDERRDREELKIQVARDQRVEDILFLNSAKLYRVGNVFSRRLRDNRFNHLCSSLRQKNTLVKFVERSDNHFLLLEGSREEVRLTDGQL